LFKVVCLRRIAPKRFYPAIFDGWEKLIFFPVLHYFKGFNQLLLAFEYSSLQHINSVCRIFPYTLYKYALNLQMKAIPRESFTKPYI